MKLGIRRSDLSNAFVTCEKEIYADVRDKEKKKKSNKDGFKSVFKNFHGIDLLG